MRKPSPDNGTHGRHGDLRQQISRANLSPTARAWQGSSTEGPVTRLRRLVWLRRRGGTGHRRSGAQVTHLSLMADALRWTSERGGQHNA